METEEVFLVSRIDEDAILGMPFLVAHNCAMEFMGLPEQIHIDQGALFESQLMTELCQLYGVDKT